MFYNITQDILLKVPDKDKAAKFFEGLGFQTNKFRDMKELKTPHFNLYLQDNDRFEMVMEFLVDDLEDAKRFCLENGCSILKWSDNDYHLKHVSGFSFNLREK